MGKSSKVEIEVIESSRTNEWNSYTVPANKTRSYIKTRIKTRKRDYLARITQKSTGR